jgi:metal-sulfur cluster biosynthetic enzyme
MSTMINTAQIWQALGEVMDPELPLSILDLGLIYGVRAQHREVEVDLTFTAIACPAMTMIIDDVREKLQSLPEVSLARVNVVWNPPWTKSRLTEQGREVLQSLGIAV